MQRNKSQQDPTLKTEPVEVGHKKGGGGGNEHINEDICILGHWQLRQKVHEGAQIKYCSLGKHASSTSRF